MKKLVFTLLGIVVLSACKGGGGGGGGGTVIVYPPAPPPHPAYQMIWYNVYGELCGSLKAGCTYVDSYSDRKAMWQNDPRFSTFASPSHARVYNTDLGFYVDAYGFFGETGVFYDYYTGRAINEGNEEKGRDVFETVGQREEDVVALAGEQLAERHALSLETGIRIARAVNDWNKIATRRERTDADLESFTQRIYGVSLAEVQKAIVNEDQAAGEKLVNEAAKTWETSPENMRKILIDMYLK